MVNINRIIKLAKTGAFYCNIFNLRKKKAQNIVDVDENDEASRWLLEQENIAPVVSDIPVQQVPMQEQSIVESLPENIEMTMDRWVKENIKEMEIEAYQNISPEDSLIGPDFVLHREISVNPKFQTELANRINIQSPAIGSMKSNLFVNTMMEKTERLKMELGEQVEERKNETEAIQQLPKKDVGDERIQFSAYERFMPGNLSDDEKNKMFSVVGEKYDDNMLSKAVEEKLSSPKREGLIDQRINFFLKYPEILQSPEFSVF